jgi:hypothetical protein
MTGQAADFTARGLSIDETMNLIISSNIDYDQLIAEYDAWLHISWSDNPRRETLEIDRSGARIYGG